MTMLGTFFMHMRAIFYRNLASQSILINQYLPLLPMQQNFKYHNRPAIKWASAYLRAQMLYVPQQISF